MMKKLLLTALFTSVMAIGTASAENFVSNDNFNSKENFVSINNMKTMLLMII